MSVVVSKILNKTYVLFYILF